MRQPITAGIGRNPCSVHPDSIIRFETRNGGNAWLWIRTPSSLVPDELLADLAAAGWTEDDRVDMTSGWTEFTINGPAGSMLFGMWTDDERAVNCATAAAVLAQFSITGVEMHDYGNGER